ncbi:MAG: MFS transporter [Candidatus Handelsmanbacteria bacterium RIFCSPLOWO2_12_FULL_64_10]|uniref:MFS transporter n=1 Tax=Handelsmanbacteria sp. (strain RIFCSPLOWO2_12_FULL_64_10) TaxID=1817868 RepID=A0A1F6D1G7_HANXR|nr:MAG: MFS transporter [Candidatus Handelsmanbacteria bacterium RIFCSPLOWO2_12_FULL_64_10]
MAEQAHADLRTEGEEYRYRIGHVIAASSVGTMIEWYDFYLYGTLAVFFSTLFYPPGHPTAAFLASLATFGAGFAVRPFGAVFFGRIGDLVGRKYAFMVTLSIMGGATTAVGLLPTYEQIGMAAPIVLVALRLLQGLALGGEYGGAATYVAEHAPDDRRGYFTSYIQTTATLGFFVALLVVLTTRVSVGDAAFKSWGWRVPFLMSAVLLAISIYIRLRLRESPLFSRLKDAGKTSRTPVKESLGSRRNWKLILLALFGATAGQAVVWYTGQFYALFFLQTALKVDYITSYLIVAVALALGTPFFLVFGWLSDRVGRKKIMMVGCLVAAVTYVPIYKAMSAFANPVNPVALTALVFIQVVYVTMVYGPIAAFLVELFPARIRYTSMSLPYHLGNGWFGGFTPLIASAIVAYTGNLYAGLSYPIAISLMTFIIGMLYLPETYHVRIWDEVEGGAPADASALKGPA